MHCSSAAGWICRESPPDVMVAGQHYPFPTHSTVKIRSRRDMVQQYL